MDVVYGLVGVDCETTGLNYQKDEILEVTAIEFNEYGQIGKTISQLCKPMSGYISPEVSKINGITYDMVRECPNYLTDGIRDKISEFIGSRTVVGHNVIEFDSKFMRINFKKAYDTLLMCRSKFSGGNKLKTACLRVNIKWDDKESHRSEYDVKKCIELYCKLREMEEKEKAKKSATPLFAIPAEVQAVYNNNQEIIKETIDLDSLNDVKVGVILNESDKKLFATQTYSYSRLNLFNQCAFKWYMQYIKGFIEPEHDYFVTGKICHKVAEWTGEWCYKETFKNKMEIFLTQRKINFQDVVLLEALAKLYNKKNKDITVRDFAEYVAKTPGVVPTYFPDMKNIGELIYTIDKSIPENSYERLSMPDLYTYNKIIENAINYYKCTNPEIINECKRIMSRFYTLKDFSLTPGDLTLTEKKLVFDKEWKPLKDFYANNAFFRGVIDVLSYFGEYVIITDYKTSRKTMNIEQLKEDRQTMTYVLLTYMFLPRGSFKKIIVRIEYIRFGETVEYEINNPQEVVDRALQWINDSIQSIEKEMLKTDGTAFMPKRNEYCHTCYLGEDGKCPLFNKQIAGKLNDPFSCSVSTIDECKAAWKRIETNKAESSRLTKLCKTFVEQCENPIKIDDNALLDFYAAKYREYDVEKTLNWLLGDKKIDITKIIKYIGISGAEIKKLMEDERIDITPEELNNISKVKQKMIFDALVPEEIKRNDIKKA